ncbi:MAG TPA: SAM-dependent chlorinase/fluorinase [Phnomibacter sp.]|nr:SAM-dependent chlorinase/fluorinase [Phnomibacter sp.]
MPIITLTSDIGDKDYLVGAIKGRLWRSNKAFQIADISHNITPFQFGEAAYFIRSAFHHFPEYSWHIILVNMFDNANPRCLLAFHEGHYFVCPDNGLLPMIFDGDPPLSITLPLTPAQIPDMMQWIDEIAKAILRMDAGASFQSLGTETEQMVSRNNLKPNFSDDWIEGRIILIDRFENVVVNINRELFEGVRKGRSFQIAFKAGDQINQISDHYGQVNEGDKLAFFNSAGYLEIAVNKGNAAGLFGLKAYNSSASDQFLKSRLFYQTVRIFFNS